ncbi:hypothetical protein DU484_19200 (plasmid) [Haloplanus rubicundus]|uniref:Uncharacterized protein n=1 Tax=Haloplanus rubicundus TaxID=1547898 RepID=A0A345EIK4_9EURY|nr:hypothetical protein DU484_19200 [Haloplanus rubicundus]
MHVVKSNPHRVGFLLSRAILPLEKVLCHLLELRHLHVFEVTEQLTPLATGQCSIDLIPFRAVNGYHYMEDRCSLY